MAAQPFINLTENFTRSVNFSGNARKAVLAGVCDSGGVVVSFPVYSSIGLNEVAYAQAERWMSKAELVMIIGAKGAYASYFQQMQKNAKLVQINPKPTRFDAWSDLNIKHNADGVFEKLTI